jgi:hypothetical protein
MASSNTVAKKLICRKKNSIIKKKYLREGWEGAKIVDTKLSQPRLHSFHRGVGR